MAAQHRGTDDAPKDRFLAQFRRQARRRHADDDGIVARHDEVDDDDLEKGRQIRVTKTIKHAPKSPSRLFCLTRLSPK
jgi:hypothetical protein